MGWMVRLAVPEMCRWLGKENEGSAKCLSPAGEGPQLLLAALIPRLQLSLIPTN